RAILDAEGKVLGVTRVGLNTTELDRITKEPVDEAIGQTPADDPHRIFLLAPSKSGPHLVAKTCPTDHIAVLDDDVRVVTDDPPPELAALLKSPLLADEGTMSRGEEAASLIVRGVPYFATVQKLTSGTRGGTRDWLVAVTVPESHYTHDLD